MQTTFDFKVSREHSKSFLRVLFLLDLWVDCLCHCVEELRGKPISERVLSPFAPQCDQSLVLANQIGAEVEQVFGRLGLESLRVWGHVDHVDLERGLHRHVAKLAQAELIVPSIPNFREGGALLRLKALNLVELFDGNEVVKESTVLSSWALLIVLDLAIPNEVVQEVLHGNSR